MIKWKKALAYSTLVLVAGGLGGVMLIKLMSTPLTQGQQTPLFEQEKVVKNTTEDKEISSFRSQPTYQKQRVIPTAISIEHGAFPTQLDLQKYIWWSEDSQQAVKFTEHYEQHLENAEIKKDSTIVSQFPYQVEGSILHYDYSQMDNAMNIEEHPSMTMVWEGDKLVLTPNDSQGYEKERSETLFPIEQIK